MPDETPDKPAATSSTPSDTAEPSAAAAARSETKAASSRPPAASATADAAPADSRAAATTETAAADKPADKLADKASDKPAGTPAAAAADAKNAGGSTASPWGNDPIGAAPVPPKRAPRFKPDMPTVRDWALFVAPLVALAGIMLYRGDVVNPRGEDPAHRLGHYATLLHSGHIPGAVIIGFLLLLASLFGLYGVLGESPLKLRGDELVVTPGERRPFMKREGAWLVGFCVLLYVPLAGAYGLWDPWETHYSEVAREILARDDWITLWWGQEGWFMSKPILIFWLAALGMGTGSAFGLPFWRDMGPGPHEWFIRLPIVAFCILAVYMVYRAVSAAWGRRAGLLAGLVLATMPHWFFLSHQAMTDMPFVAPLVVAMAFLMLAVVTDPEALARPRAVKLFGRTLRFSLWHVVVGAIFLVAMPQVLYLLTRPVLMACPDDADRSCQAVLEASRIGGLQFPIERYWSGSAGNSAYHDLSATVPGSPAWEDRYNQVPFMPSFMQGLFLVALGTWVFFSLRRERRLQGLYFPMVYLFGAISFMGKGPAGLFLPEIVLFGFMITTGKWHLLRRMRLLQGFAGIYLLCGFPWYVAIYCRLGNEFFDRFVVHDLLNRAFAGVHGDTGTFRYFVWQLGYAMFPWTGFVPAALAGWKLLLPARATEAQKDLVRITTIWFLVTFTLFSLMVTKFHHYIFPAVPSCALLVGLLLNRMLGDRALARTRGTAVSAGALVLGVALLVFGITNFFGAWHGRVSREAPFQLPPGSWALGIVCAGLGVAAIAYAWNLARQLETPLGTLAEMPPFAASSETDVTRTPRDPAVDPDAAAAVGATLRDGAPPVPVEPAPGSPMAKYIPAALGAVGVGATVLLALIARDIGIVGQSRPAGFERFIHLFIYNYERPFPTRSYDYHAILTGFGVVAVLTAALFVANATRRYAVRTMIALAAVFAFWGLDKYMIDLSNHWSQRNLFERYYAVRHTRETLGYGEDARYWADPIVAYQMNWKGENFYTGNHAAMLECGLPLCRERTPEWLRRHAGQRVFFVTEHSRASSVIGQVRQVNGTAHTITDEYDNNKFVLVEAQL